MCTPASRTAFVISDTEPDGTEVFQFFILMIDSLTLSMSIKITPFCLSETNYSYPMQIGVQKLFMKAFPSYCLFLITNGQHIIFLKHYSPVIS